MANTMKLSTRIAIVAGAIYGALILASIVYIVVQTGANTNTYTSHPILPVECEKSACVQYDSGSNRMIAIWPANCSLEVSYPMPTTTPSFEFKKLEVVCKHTLKSI